MTGLAVSLSLVLALVCAAFGIYAWKSGVQGAYRPALAAVVAVLIVGSVGVYASIGRFGDWQHAAIDNTRDHRLAAKITQARRAAAENPENTEALKELSALYMQGSLFDESVSTLDRLLSLTGPKAALYGQKARALYYRDRRNLTPEVKETLDQALALNPAESASRMLLAEHAFRGQDYQTAIREWEIILKAHSAPGQERAIQNAVAKAREKLAHP